MAPVAIPARRGGWWHAYVCDLHGVELEHTGLDTGEFPSGGAACRYGCRHDGAPIQGAWAVLAHQHVAQRIWQLAAEQPAERRGAQALLAEYSRLYHRLAAPPEPIARRSDATADRDGGAAGWMLPGRLFHQALTEAIWAVRIGHAAWTLARREGGAAARPALPMLDSLVELMCRARGELVASGRFTSNYTAWLNAAGVVCSTAAARIRGGGPDEDWLHGPYGLLAHVLAATGADGWEWEGSTYYHHFVLRAYLLGLRDRSPAELPEPVVHRLQAMVDVLAELATDGGLLPALHDGPYRRPDTGAEVTELVDLVHQFTAGRPLAHLARSGGTSRCPPHLEDWFAGTPLAGPRQRPASAVVRLHRDAGYAVLHDSGIHAILDFGPHGGAHGHRDKLALYLYPAAATDAGWQPDPGQVPYAHAALREHYAGTYAHPTFRVGTAEQASGTGQLVRCMPGSVTATASDAYPGIRARRHVGFGPGGILVDVLHVSADTPVSITCQLRPGVPVSYRRTGTALVSTWDGPPRLYGQHLCDVPASPLARPAPGTADDPQAALTWLDWTAQAAVAATFLSVYAVTDTVAALRLAAPGTLAITRTDGTTIEYDWED